MLDQPLLELLVCLQSSISSILKKINPNRALVWPAFPDISPPWYLLKMPSITLPILCTVIATVCGLAIDPITSSLAKPNPARRDTGEHVLLCNCLNNGISSSEVAYYSGSPSGLGSASVVVDTNYDSTVWWEGASQSVTFSDGDVFSWYIVAQVPVGTYAWTAKNGYTSFYCYNEWDEFQYTTSDGTDCTVVYDCNHNTPMSAVAGDETDIYYDLSSNYVAFPPAFTTITWTILNWAFNQFDWTTGQTVDDTSLDLGNGVSISFTGHGNVPGTTLLGLATVLRQVVSAQSGLISSWTEQVATSCALNCEHGECCQWNYETVAYWQMAQTVTVYAENTATNSDQGSLSKYSRRYIWEEFCNWLGTFSIHYRV